MKSTVSILLVHNGRGPVPRLEAGFSGSPVILLRSHSCIEAGAYILRPDPPHLVVTEVALPDGTWSLVAEHARQAVQPVNVIVVASYDDPDLYLEIMQQGVFDCVTPPFDEKEFYRMVRGALSDVMTRRNAAAARARACCTGLV
jgi:DNA-binding NtrC family response regulator